MSENTNNSMWTYLKFTKRGINEGCILTPSSLWPPEGSIFLAYECLRGRVVVGFRERGIGCLSILSPNVDDDANIAAFAPLGEQSEPDLSIIARNIPKCWSNPAYKENPANPWVTIYTPTAAADRG